MTWHNDLRIDNGELLVMETKNVKFVAFLRMQGIHSDKVEKYARGKAKYCFTTMSEETWEQHKKEFDRSPFLTYAQNLDSVIDLAY
mgnify:CR=1 FL=1